MTFLKLIIYLFFQSYRNQFPTSLNEEFYGNYLIALERSLALSVQDVKMRRISIPEGVELLAGYVTMKIIVQYSFLRTILLHVLNFSVLMKHYQKLQI